MEREQMEDMNLYHNNWSKYNMQITNFLLTLKKISYVLVMSVF